MGRKPKAKINAPQKVSRKRKTKTKNKIASKFIPSMDLQEIYIIINEVQIRRIEKILIVQKIDAPVLENILLDCEILWKRKDSNTGIEYHLTPPVEKATTDEDFDFDEEFDDELTDEDHLF